MTETFFARLKQATEEPDCIGCGYCCWKMPCELAYRAYPDLVKGPCPELVWDEEAGRHWCGVFLRAEGRIKKYINNGYLFIGAGCCSSLNDWRYEKIIDRTNWQPDHKKI